MYLVGTFHSSSKPAPPRPVQGQGTPQCQEADGPPGAEGGAAGAEGGVAGPTPVPGGVLGHLGYEEVESARSWC